MLRSKLWHCKRLSRSKNSRFLVCTGCALKSLDYSGHYLLCYAIKGFVLEGQLLQSTGTKPNMYYSHVKEVDRTNKLIEFSKKDASRIKL